MCFCPVWKKGSVMHNNSMSKCVYMLFNVLSPFLPLPVDCTLTECHILTSSEPGASVGTIYVLKMPGEPFLIKRDETSVVCTAEPGEMLHGCKYWFCLFSPCGVNVVDPCGWIFALINDQRLKWLRFCMTLVVELIIFNLLKKYQNLNGFILIVYKVNLA